MASCNRRFWTSSAPPWSLRPRFLGVRWGWGRGLLTPLLRRARTESVSSVSEPDPPPSDHKQHRELTAVKHDVKSSDETDHAHLHLNHSISLKQRRLRLSVKNKWVFAHGHLRVHDLHKTDRGEREDVILCLSTALWLLHLLEFKLHFFYHLKCASDDSSSNQNADN